MDPYHSECGALSEVGQAGDRQGTGRGEDIVWKFKSDEAMIFCMCM